MATMSAVRLVDDERGDGHGWWFYLRKGLKWGNRNTHSIHRETKAECLYELKNSVVECDCAECVKAP